MKYITRTVYDVMQTGSDAPPEFLERSWRDACDCSRDRLAEIHGQLPECMQAFSEITLHDGIIRSVDTTKAGEVTFEIDGNGCCWGPRGQMCLTFAGVRSATGLETAADSIWLYEEVDLHPDAAFEYSVLTDLSDFSIAADAVRLEILTSPDESHGILYA